MVFSSEDESAHLLAPEHMTDGKPSIRQIPGNLREFEAEIDSLA